MKRITMVYTVIALIALALVGCGDELITNGDKTKFVSYGLLFNDPNTNTSFCYGVFKSQGQTISGLQADLILSSTDSVRLNPIGGSAYWTQDGSFTLAPDSSYILRADDDQGEFYIVQSLYIPDTFRVTVAQPATRIYQNGNVIITWDAPSDTVGYFVTIVPPDETVTPYAEFTSSNTATFSASTFTRTTGERVTGIYKFYVVAYYETFYSDPLIENNDKIFFPYPDTGFVDNISTYNNSGRFGSAIISYYDSVQVIAEP